MTRRETIDKYVDAFLKGRSQSAIDKFMDKAEALQYASIMQWRRRMKKAENTPKSTREVLDILHKADALIANAQELNTQDVQDINSALDKLHNTLNDSFNRSRERRISELEAQQNQIAAQLEQLRQG
ncbi:MAG: hypothetical protein NC217_01035 [Muribaculaceae bacterium]|nr:hypothetical protein [Muribaculaceae bacterium]